MVILINISILSNYPKLSISLFIFFDIAILSEHTDNTNNTKVILGEIDNIGLDINFIICYSLIRINTWCFHCPYYRTNSPILFGPLEAFDETGNIISLLKVNMSVIAANML